MRLVQSSVVLIDFSFVERGETEPLLYRVFTVDSLEHTRSEKNVRGLLLFQVNNGKDPLSVLEAPASQVFIIKCAGPCLGHLVSLNLH